MKTMVNPRPTSVRLHLSDGSERLVPPWGIAFLPDRGADGQALTVTQAETLLGAPEPEERQRAA